MKERERNAGETSLADSSDSNSDNTKAVDVRATYSKMLEVMRPGENVLRCIRRLGGGLASSKANRK